MFSSPTEKDLDRGWRPFAPFPDLHFIPVPNGRYDMPRSHQVLASFLINREGRTYSVAAPNLKDPLQDICRNDL
jgi:hypothetical protein